MTVTPTRNWPDYLTDIINRLMCQGTFHPRKSLVESSMAVEGKVVHFDYKNIPSWGVTFAREKDDFSSPVGYFHKHGDKKQYVIPNPPEHAGKEVDFGLIVACLPCGVYIVGKWE